MHRVVAAGRLVWCAIAEVAVDGKVAHLAVGIVVQPIHKFIATLVIQALGHAQQGPLCVRFVAGSRPVHGCLHPHRHEILFDETAEILVCLDMGQALGVQKRDDLVVLVYRGPDHVIGLGINLVVSCRIHVVDSQAGSLQKWPLIEPALAQSLHLPHAVSMPVVCHRRQISVLNCQS